MPAFNEAELVATAIEQVKSQFTGIVPDYEIIVVDDGSTDATKIILEKLEDDQVRLVSYAKNQGKGHAIRRGFSRVTGEITFYVDSDAEIMPRELIRYIQELESADIAIGSKRHPDSWVDTIPVRKFLSLGFNVLERLLTGVKVTDTQAGFKGIRSKALYRIVPLMSVKKYAFDLELLAIASLLNLRISELPVEINLKATVNIERVFRMLIDTLGIAFRIRIKRWYQRNIANMSNTYDPILHW